VAATAPQFAEKSEPAKEWSIKKEEPVKVA